MTRPSPRDNPKVTATRVQIDGSIDHGWLLLVRALFPHGDSFCGAHAITRTGSQPLHLIPVV